ncbi:MULTISPECIES: hypothetical protein [Bacillus]|uniref:hypothetical protein n=1 Tax=Bacillus TaxID=1386 RepID=UPI0021117A9B|nr:hypothetical protein [Bacillus paranthracis]MCQ6520782.1 hypothetical protein [Bacillus paranthracis]MCU5229244.1 hypothetical protein [Bacillus paranthracis]MEC4604591.1 hypothetical protein [Bacillus paranthracis]
MLKITDTPEDEFQNEREIRSITQEELEMLQEINACTPMFGEYLSEENDEEEIDEEQQRYDFALDLKMNELNYEQYKETWEKLGLSQTKIAEYRISIGAGAPVHIMSNGYYSKNIRKVGEEIFEKYLSGKDKVLEYIPWYALYFILVTRKVDELGGTAYGKEFINDQRVKYDFTDEKCAYIGQTNSNRFKNGHTAFTKLNAPIFDGYEKRIYMASISIKFEGANTYIPLEFIPNAGLVDDIKDYIESALICYIDNIFNVTSDKQIKTSGYKFIKNIDELHPSQDIKLKFNLSHEYFETKFFKDQFPTIDEYKIKFNY